MKNLDETIEKHFKAIKNRNINDLLETVDSDKITLILPNGQYSNSVNEYKATNMDWFSDMDWEIDYQIIDKIINENSSIVLTKISYSDLNEKGEPYAFSYYLTLVFKQTNNKWKLIFDQNTIIKS